MKFIKLNQNKQCEFEHERRPMYRVYRVVINEKVTVESESSIKL